MNSTLESKELKFRPGELWHDTSGVVINAHGGGILHHEGRYWWYGEHKVAGPEGNTAQVGVRVYSSPDLFHWQDEGIALAVSDNLESDIARGAIIERPKVIFNPVTRKFVMWFHLEKLGQGYACAMSGVAVADRPAGPFTFIESFRPNRNVWPDNLPAELKVALSSDESEGLAKRAFDGASAHGVSEALILRRDFSVGQMARDMTLFVDDDGKAYHLYSSEENGTLHLSLLTDDWCRPAGRFIRIMPGRFHEAPALMKHDGNYYLFSSGCTGWSPNPARLSVAPSIWGPWKELGNPCEGTSEQRETTFNAQSTFVLAIANKPGCFIFVADRWMPENPIDGRYVWLPVKFKDGIPCLSWADEWTLSDFESLEYSGD